MVVTTDAPGPALTPDTPPGHALPEAAHPALHLGDQPPVYRVARHGLVMAKPETEICSFSISFIWDEMAKCKM